MTIGRKSLADIEAEILEIFGYANSLSAPWRGNNATDSSARLYKRVNNYLQRLPMRLNQLAGQMRQVNPGRLPYNGVPRFDMWKSSGNVTMSAAGNQVGYLPTDYDHWINFRMTSSGDPVYPVENVRKYHPELYTASNSATPTHLEIMGFVSNNNAWQRQVNVWPNVTANVTPALTVEYWRIPAAMPGNNAAAEYPDIDPKYESLSVYGPVVDLARPNAPEFDRYNALEKEILVELLMTAKGT